MDDDYYGTIPSSVSSYEKGRKVFEKMNAYKEITYNRRVSSAEEKAKGCVKNRKKFFENHISEQKERESAMCASTQSNCTSPTTALSLIDDSSTGGLIIFDDRTDSESHSFSSNNRMNPETPSQDAISKSNSFDSESDIEPSELMQNEYNLYGSKETNESEIDVTLENENSRKIELSHSYIRKAESLDAKMIPFIESSSNTIAKKPNEKHLELDQDDDILQKKTLSRYLGDSNSGCVDRGNELITEPKVDKISSTNADKKEIVELREPIESLRESGNSVVENNSDAYFGSYHPTVKIQVTTNSSETPIRQQQEDRVDVPPKISEETDDSVSSGKVDIDNMIKEFRLASFHLAEGLFSHSNHDRPLSNETKSCDSDCGLNPLSSRDFQQISNQEKVSESKNDSSTKTTDETINAKKATKPLPSTNASSKTKSKGNHGMGKMFKRARNRMGKSVKNLTSAVKNTMKTKAVKAPEQEKMAVGRVSVMDKTKRTFEFYDSKLAAELMYSHKGITRASQYLVAGKRLLGVGARARRESFVEESKDYIRKAHTYAYVARQLAKHYLWRNRNDIFIGTGMNPSDLGSVMEDDGASILAEIFDSLMHCVGPCENDENLVYSRIQVDETLDILSKVSEEETFAVNKMAEKAAKKGMEKSDDCKENIRAAIVKSLRGGTFFDSPRDCDTVHNRNIAIRRFVTELKSFYVEDTSLNLTPIIEMEISSFEPNRRRFYRMDESCNSTEASETTTERSLISESKSYSYIEPLKDHGDNFFTRSFSTSYSMNRESSFQRDRRKQEFLRREDVDPVNTTLPFSSQNQQSKVKVASSSNASSLKKKPGSTRKWFPVGGRRRSNQSDRALPVD